MKISELQPQGIWKNFYALTQVPRPSGHLDKIRAYLMQWAQDHGLEHFTDNAGNVIIRKPASAGMEDHKTVTMEAHMDMVPQKVQDSNHNFLTDPIDTYIDGDWVKARGTTLGSDDGIGVATALAVFEDANLKHGPLEAIFTVDEETCMYGVNNLKPDTLKGDILLNLDNETEGEFVIGSAGGMDVVANLEYTEQAPEAGSVSLKLSLSGLKGGHSGLEINEGRANANKLLANIAREALDKGFDLSEWDGGNMRNAIPSFGYLVLTVADGQQADVEALAAKWQATYREEYKGIEEGITIKVEALPAAQNIIPRPVADGITNAVLAAHVGVYRYIPSIPDIVETSCNLGIVKAANGKAEADVLVRSSMDSKLDELASSVTAALRLGGFTVTYSGRYPAWQPDTESPLARVIEKVYRDLYNEEAKITVVHAGLECGIIKTVYPNMDGVSFGPTLRSPHTPLERCNIPSVAKYYEFVIQLLENL